MKCRDDDGWKWSSHRNLSLCAEEGVVLGSLLAVFILTVLVRIPFLSHLSTRVISRTSRRRLWVKLILLALAFVTSLITFFFVLSGHISTAVRLPYALEPLALFLALCLTRLNHLRTRSSSTILLLFWPTYTVASSIWTRSYVQSFPVIPLIPLKWAVLSLSLLSFGLECISPDDTPHSNSESPTLTANIFSIWSFSWLTPLLRKGSRVVVTADDLPTLVPRDESDTLGNIFQCNIEKYPNLWTTLFITYGGPFLFAGLLKIIQDSLAFVQPVLLRALLSYISEYQDNKSGDLPPRTTSPSGYTIAFLMFAASIAQTILLHQYLMICIETNMRIRAALVTTIYKKALVLSSDERGRASGDIVNLMSVDATRMQDFCQFGFITISVLYQVALAFISLYNLLGWSAFAGVAIMILSIPLNTSIARMLKSMNQQQMKTRDKRTRLMNELLANIKSIKLYAWDFAFIRRVLHIRNDLELKILRKIGIATAMNTTLWSSIPLIVAFSSFAAASVFSTTPLTADVIFPSISLFMLLRSPLTTFSQMTFSMVEAMVSVKRLSKFLCAEELQEDAVKRIEKHSLSIGEEILSISDGEFKWSKNDIQPTLEGINLTVCKGELVGVLGRVGAGKSSLLSAVIGDMRKTEGEIVLSGSIAYASQNPWILSATIRDNILFSHTYDESFYNLVIESCALEPDLAVLKQGDMTEVGEKGITLSGGQRARVALARAVYARADLVLLDDVLAAVDSQVAHHIFNKVIGPRGLLATKARIMATNNIVYLTYFDQIAYLRRGIILECGSYRQLVSNPDSAVRKLVHDHTANGSSGAASGEETPMHTSGNVSTLTTSANSTEEALIDEVESAEKLVRRKSFTKALIAPLPLVREVTNTGLSKEHSEQGHVKKRVYLQYLQAASKTGFCFFVLTVILGQVATVMSTFMLRLWGESNRGSGRHTGLSDSNLRGYGFFCFVSIVMSAVGGLLFWMLCTLRSSKYLHDSMLLAVMRAPLSFFETTPTGRILNVFSRDMYIVDSVLGGFIQNLVREGAATASILMVIGFIFPPFFIGIIPLAWFYYRVTVYYLTTSRELKRLDAVSKSPIFAWFSESLSGLSTIRAYNQQAIFVAQNALRIDRNNMCSLPCLSLNRWLAIRLEFVGAVIILFTAILAVSAVVTSNVDVSLVGMVLSYALTTTDALYFLVRAASEMEQNVVSVERITHYVNDLPFEAPNESPDRKPPVDWPVTGQVEFQAFSMRYRPELDLVLKDVSLTIEPKEKIGIVGRTGAGKSSFLLALFRTLDAASGKILIDGVDISTIGLNDLRSAISIVPQSPDMFEGTLRENIDPAGEHQDVDIWVALDHANLKADVESFPEGLDAPVQEGGASLSAGQKQLLCFARALLRKSKILVLDEATSAVDLDTDRAIQAIIRGPLFDEVTILTVAHRLNTILDSHRVLVLDQGRVAEFDAPGVLLEDKSSRFYSMALEAGLVRDEQAVSVGNGERY